MPYPIMSIWSPKAHPKTIIYAGFIYRQKLEYNS